MNNDPNPIKQGGLLIKNLQAFLSPTGKILVDSVLNVKFHFCHKVGSKVHH